jgi:integrase
MASLSREDGRGSWKLTWCCADKRRRSIRIGAMPKRSAEQFKARLEELLHVRRVNGPLSAGLDEWINGLPDDLRERLVGAGLITARERLTLGQFCDQFLATRERVAEATAVRDRQVISLLVDRFGADRPLDSITVRDAEEWRNWLATAGNRRDKSRVDLADNTVRRRVGTARQIFAKGVRWGLLRSNPFEGMPVTVNENLSRRVFVTWGDILRVIELAPSVEWRALLAFVRLTGCRVPSELCGLTWADVDFVARRVVLRSPKTAHHGGEHALRSVPLFPELVPYLQELSDAVGPGVCVPLSDPVFPMAIDPKANLRTHLERLIVRAGVTPWPKLFVNLRSSRETELLAKYPVADVCRWMGHSPTVAAKHYAQARPEIADRAAVELTVESDPVGAPAGARSVGNGAKMGAITTTTETGRGHQENPQTVAGQGLMKPADGLRGQLHDDINGRHWTRTSDPRRVKTVL